MESPCMRGFLAEAGDLVICMGDVALHDILEEVDISDDGAAVEPVVEGRHWNILPKNHAGLRWNWVRWSPSREFHVLYNLVN